MRRNLLARAGVLVLLGSALAAPPSLAEKAVVILKMYSPDSPASMSILEEATIVSERPMMGVFNNLVMFDQHVKQNSLQSGEGLAVMPSDALRSCPIWPRAGRGMRREPS